MSKTTTTGFCAEDSRQVTTIQLATLPIRSLMIQQSKLLISCFLRCTRHGFLSLTRRIQINLPVIVYQRYARILLEVPTVLLGKDFPPRPITYTQ